MTDISNEHRTIGRRNRSDCVSDSGKSFFFHTHTQLRKDKLNRRTHLGQFNYPVKNVERKFIKCWLSHLRSVSVGLCFFLFNSPHHTHTRACVCVRACLLTGESLVSQFLFSNLAVRFIKKKRTNSNFFNRVCLNQK